MYRLFMVITMIFVSSASGAGERVEELNGVWESQLKARYVSDGTNFKCIHIPDSIMKKYAHWLNKNRLEDLKKENGDITATQILRRPEGIVGKVKATIIINGDNMELTVVAKNGKTRVSTFTKI